MKSYEYIIDDLPHIVYGLWSTKFNDFPKKNGEIPRKNRSLSFWGYGFGTWSLWELPAVDVHFDKETYDWAVAFCFLFPPHFFWQSTHIFDLQLIDDV